MKYENHSTDIDLIIELYKVPCLVNKCRIATEFFVKVSIQRQMDIATLQHQPREQSKWCFL